MNVKIYRSAKMLSFVLAASLALGSAAMAADTGSIHEADSTAAGITEQDVPVEVGDVLTGTALGVGTVTALGPREPQHGRSRGCSPGSGAAGRGTLPGGRLVPGQL